MPLKAIRENLDGLSDTEKSLYKEHDGTYRLDVEDAESLVDTTGLKRTISTLREREKELEKWRKAFPDKTPDELSELIAAAGSNGKPGDKGEGAPDVDALRKKLRKEMEEEYRPKLTELEQEKAKRRDLVLTHRLRSVLEQKEMNVFPERIEAAIKLTRDRFQLDERENINVLDEQGEISALTVEQFWSGKAKKLYPWLFKAPDASGSDTRSDTRPPAKPADATIEELNKLPPAARLTEARKRGIGKIR